MNILAIGSHPDDVEIGCGGTLLRYAKAGHNVNLLVLTAGGSGGDKEKRVAEQSNAKKYMKARTLYWGLDLEDTKLPTYGSLLMKTIENIVNAVKADIVFSHYKKDTHQDHRAVALATLSACRYVKEVLFYEVPTTQNFQPDIFVDIGEVINKKMELLKCHASQVEKTGIKHLSLLREVEACANFRGVQAKVKYAEGFKAWRMLKDIEALV